MKKLIFFLFIFSSILRAFPAFAEAHVIEKGETALQIALEHHLTMDQLQQLNPGTDLEMMLVGDILVVPDEGSSFEDYLSRVYGEFVSVTDRNCEILADRSALCLFHIGNSAVLPLFDVQIRAEVRGRNGVTNRADSGISMMQILPGEKLPAYVIVSGPFDEIESAVITVRNLSWSELFQSSFRVPPGSYTQTVNLLPDGSAAAAGLDFSPAAEESYREKHINVQAAAYDADGVLVGVRSMYSQFYPRLDITVYSNGHRISSVETRLEVY